MTVAIASSIDLAMHPRFEKLNVRESRQAPDRLVDLTDRDPPGLTIEEVLRHELELTRRPDAGADRSPEVVDEEAGDPGGGRAPQPLLGLMIIKEEVAGFIAHDPLQPLLEDRGPGGGFDSEVSRPWR